MIKKILTLLLMLSLFSCEKNKYDTFLGSQIGNIIINEFNNDFLMEKVDSSGLLKIVSGNGYSFSAKTKLSDVIKKTESLYISIGEYDLLKNIVLVDRELVVKYNPSLLEIFSMNLVEIINELTSYNDNLKIGLFSLYNPYAGSELEFMEAVNQIVEKFNQEIIEISNDYNCMYFDIRIIEKKLESFNQFNLSIKSEIMEIINHDEWRKFD